MSLDLRGEFRAVHAVLSNPILADIDSELRLATDVTNLTFCRLGSYALEGEITQIIRSNGAYRNSDVSTEDARAMSRDFVDALSGGMPETLIAYRTYDYWADWFCDVAWDITLVVMDANHRRWWLVCVTDTD